MWDNMDEAEQTAYDAKRGGNCICNRGEEFSAHWVQCDLCDVWYHVECAKIGRDITKIMAFYHCFQCIKANFRSLGNYIWYRERVDRDDFSDTTSNNSKNVFDAWDDKTKELKQLIGNHCFPFFYHSVIPYRGEQMRGMQNIYNNCWLNVVLQVICGSSFRKLLPALDQPDKMKMNSILKELEIGLSRSASSPFMINEKILDLSNLLGNNMSLLRRQQQDAVDGYTGILTMISEECERCDEEFSDMTMKLVTFTRCSGCKKTSAVVDNCFVYPIEILECHPTIVLELSDLIWNSMTCNYEFSEKKICKFCSIAASKASSLIVKNFLEPPILLSLSLQRVGGGNPVANKAAVNFPESINMEKLTCSWNFAEKLAYSLFGWISWSGRTVNSGHYTAYLRKNESEVFHINDEVITAKELKDVLSQDQTRRDVQMLLYLREDCKKELEIKTSQLGLRTDAIYDIENLWKAEVSPPTDMLVKNEDFFTASGNCHLNGQIVDSFFKAVSADVGSNTHCVTSYLYESLLLGQVEKDTIKHVLQNKTLLSKDIILIPIHNRAIGHWAVVGVFTKLKIMVYCDSASSSSDQTKGIFRIILSLIKSFDDGEQPMSLSSFIQEWTLIATDSIERQPDNNSCGVYCCLNGYRLLTMSRFVEATSWLSTQKLRYWICAKARRVECTHQKSQHTERRFAFIENKFAKLQVHNRIPVQTLMLLAGKPTARKIVNADIFLQLETLHETSLIDQIWTDESDIDIESSEGNGRDELQAADVEILETCERDLGLIEDFSDEEDTIKGSTSERLSALQKLTKRTFMNLSAEDMKDTVREASRLELMEILKQIADRLYKKLVSYGGEMKRTCRLTADLCINVLTLRAPRGGRKRPPPLGFSSVVFARGMILKRNFG